MDNFKRDVMVFIDELLLCHKGLGAALTAVNNHNQELGQLK
jgi:hypothetical protein